MGCSSSRDGKAQGDGAKRTHTNDQCVRALPAPEAKAELQPILSQRSLSSRANAESKSKRFPSTHIDPTISRDDVKHGSISSRLAKNDVESLSGRLVELASAGGAGEKKNAESDARAPTKQFTGRNEI